MSGSCLGRDFSSMVGLSRVWLSLGLVVSLTAALLMGLPSQAGAVAGYGDVGEGTWYTDAVQWSTDNGITDIAGPCFGPDTPVSRGETAVWIYNMENQPDAGNSHSFSDVTDASQNDAISWMANTGITTGTSPTTFAPDETLKRAQAAAFLHRLAGEPAAPAHNFVDVVTAWQQGGVSWMAHTGITTGTSPTTFAPEDTLTRAHLVTFLYRYQDEPDVTVNTSTPDCDPEQTEPSQDRHALIALYNSTGGADWTVSKNWLSDRPLHEWHGVVVNANGRVVELWLTHNGLSGRIPSELGNLANLNFLTLGENQLSGRIPSELGNLGSLETLHLSGNQLSGRIPSELGNLTNLNSLALFDNQLSGRIPSELGNLANLRYLDIAYNQLTNEIPGTLGNLDSLVSLRLAGNDLSGRIPSEMGNLGSLETLHLSGNQLTDELPEELGNLVDLVSLDVADNLITDISALSELTNLREVSLADNHISDLTPLGMNSELGVGDTVDVRGNPLNERSISNVIPALTGKGVNVLFDERLDILEPQIYNDNLFILPVSENIVLDTLPLREYVQQFYKNFEDAFDFLFLISNLPAGEADLTGRGGAYYVTVRNDVEGIGLPLTDDDSWGSSSELEGVIASTYGFQDRNPGWNFFSDSTALHEVMHRWANFSVPTSHGAHWGFSSSYGQLGGFDIANLVDHGNGQYTAGDFDHQTGLSNPSYSPIELYLAGFIPAIDVPGLWVAEDGNWLLDAVGNHVLAANGYPVFTASRPREYTIDDLIASHGPRTPDVSQAQKDFRAAVILLIDSEHPANPHVLDVLSDHVSLFGHVGDNGIESQSFYEATGGRGTLNMNGLSQFAKKP